MACISNSGDTVVEKMTQLQVLNPGTTDIGRK